MITIRRRFPNFVCDGMPLGPDESAYLHSFEKPEEFFELEWVKEMPHIVHWYLSEEVGGSRLVMGKEEDGTYWAFAWLLEGEPFLPVEAN